MLAPHLATLKLGRHGETRTLNLSRVKRTLSPLSYAPEHRGGVEPRSHVRLQLPWFTPRSACRGDGWHRLQTDTGHPGAWNLVDDKGFEPFAAGSSASRLFHNRPNLVVGVGFEPTTYRLSTDCSEPLSYPTVSRQ